MKVFEQTNRKSILNYLGTPDLKDIHLFNQLSNDELSMLEHCSSRSRLKRGTIIYHEGRKHSGIYCILKGVVKVFKMGMQGKEQILRFAHKGNLLAHRSLFTGELACSSVKVIEEVVVCYIPTNILVKLFEQNWGFRLAMMKMACKELRESNSFVTEIAHKSVRERTAEMLLYLQDEFGLDYTNTIKIRVTRVELANKLGTATESVIRVLTEFKNEGLVNLKGRQISILNSARLRRIADFHIYRQYSRL